MTSFAVCPNGHRAAAPGPGASRDCPVCGAPLAAEPSDRPPPEATSGATAAVEWRLASPDGAQQFGPTVEAVFAQWVREGRVRPDWLVWRTGWSDWRPAAAAAAELPGAPPPPPTAPAAPVATAKPSRPNAGAIAEYRSRRQAARRTRVALAAVLGFVALGLIGLLAWLLGSGG